MGSLGAFSRRQPMCCTCGEGGADVRYGMFNMNSIRRLLVYIVERCARNLAERSEEVIWLRPMRVIFVERAHKLVTNFSRFAVPVGTAGVNIAFV